MIADLKHQHEKILSQVFCCLISTWQKVKLFWTALPIGYTVLSCIYIQYMWNWGLIMFYGVLVIGPTSLNVTIFICKLGIQWLLWKWHICLEPENNCFIPGSASFWLLLVCANKYLQNQKNNILPGYCLWSLLESMCIHHLWSTLNFFTVNLKIM